MEDQAICFMFVMLSYLFIAALWSPAGKGVSLWGLALLCVMFNCVFVTFPFAVLGQLWYLFVLIPGRCLLTNFLTEKMQIFHFLLSNFGILDTPKRVLLQTVTI